MNERSTLPTVSNIVAEAGEQVLFLFDKYANNRLLFHNYSFTQRVLRHLQELARETGAPADTVEIAQLAASFLHIGYLFEYEHFLRYSLDQAQRFLALRDYPESGQRSVLRCIQTIATRTMPASLEEKNISR